MQKMETDIAVLQLQV